MKNNKYFLNTALAAVLGIALLIMMLVRTFVPMAVMPRLDIPNMVLVSLAALLLEHYLTGGSKGGYPGVFLLSGLTFGLLPLAAFFAQPLEAVKLAAVGGCVFTASAWVFRSMQDRLSSGPAAKLAPVMGALGLYLAAQCFAGLL
ncbi:MAG: hypothetical protein IJA45_08065 [Oscillospiraceae bacterium]|nr:hypothetical protein [Oscillospiraceae bacterium]